MEETPLRPIVYSLQFRGRIQALSSRVLEQRATAPSQVLITTVDANGRPVYLFLKYAGQAMVRAGGGSFVAISSTAAVFSTKYLASYAAGKAAVDQLVRVAANELGELGVRVNSVQPGLHATNRLLSLHGGNAEAAAAGIPVGFVGDPDDFGAVVAFLCSTHARFVTGAALQVAGGAYAGLQ